MVSLLHLPRNGIAGDTGDWIMWTPQGYFTASTAGEKLVGWRINKGPDQAAEFVTAEQTRKYFFRADVVERAIVLASAERSVEEFDKGGNLSPFRLADLVRRSPPRLFPLAPPRDTTVTSGHVEVKFGRLNQPEPISKYLVFVNGTQVGEVTPQSTEPASWGEIYVRCTALPRGQRHPDSRHQCGPNSPRVRRFRTTKMAMVRSTSGATPTSWQSASTVTRISRVRTWSLPAKMPFPFTNDIVAQLQKTHSGEVISSDLVYGERQRRKPTPYAQQDHQEPRFPAQCREE